MKGFAVSMNESLVSATLENGGTGIIITNKSGDFILDFSGIDNEGKSYCWMYKKLELGDCVTIKYNNNDNPSIPNSKLIKRKEYTDEELLVKYNRLKQELTDRSLI